MRGITEERLEELLSVTENKEHLATELCLKMLLAECKELSAWLPIESAPKDRRILLFYPKHRGLGWEFEQSYIVASEYNTLATIKHQPTHWQELPEDPK